MIEFIREATVGNVHAFWHFAGGMFLYKIFQTTPIVWRFPFRTVVIIAALYEIVTLYLYGYGGYSGGAMGYLADTTGDILLAVVGAFVILKKE